MALVLALRRNLDNEIVANLADGQELARTPADRLPELKRLQADVFTQGRSLMQALGGSALITRLEQDADNLLLLDCDDETQGIAWEYAVLPDAQLLVAQYGCLRLVDRDCPPSPTGPINFVALAADPLVDAQDNPREGYRLDLDNELRGIRKTLAESGVALSAQRIAPTQAALRRALRKGPAVLHLTCHGNVVTIGDGPMAVLDLEDDDGKSHPLLGRDLIAMPPRGVLRSVVLSACHSASAQESSANLAKAIVCSGVPFAIGMQAAFPDTLSDDVANAFYETVLAGHSLAEALRQARQALLNYANYLGLVVGYTARKGWAALPLQEGQPQVGGLGLPGGLRLTGEVQPPRPILGRNRELHELAALYSAETKVITINGTGGMGKTALAASFAERFAWRWPQGVRAISFASDIVNAADFRRKLLRELIGQQQADQLADAARDDQESVILQVARDWDGLLLIDNYESVLQRLPGQTQQKTSEVSEVSVEPGAHALAIHQLLGQLARGGSAMLLTSRELPTQFHGERVYPKLNEPLHGLTVSAGATLFIEKSALVKEAQVQYRPLAEQIASSAEGHPLAIALLGGQFSVSGQTPEAFAADWATALRHASNASQLGHHRSFEIAFRRSYDPLPTEQQRRLRQLSVFGFPFFRRAAKHAWELAIEDATDASADEGLHYFTHRNLLDVDGAYQDDTRATYRFQPAMREMAQLAAHQHGDAEETTASTQAYADYADWFVNYAYDEATRQPAIARLTRDASAELIRLTPLQSSERLAGYAMQLGYLLEIFGQIGAADAVLRQGAEHASHSGDLRRQSSVLYRQASLAVTRGQLEQAMALYQQSAAIDEQLGDLKGKSATLSMQANIHMEREDWAAAQTCLNESLLIAQQLQSPEAIAFSTVKLGQIAEARGERDAALERYREGLAIFEQLGMPRESEQVRRMIANVEGGANEQASATPNPLHEAIGEARAADQRGDAAAAVVAQRQAIALLKAQPDVQQGQRDALVTLSVLLYNLAGYYGKAGRHTDAVRALEEVVALDEQTGHEDLSSDRQALAQAQARASGQAETIPDEAELSPEQREQMEAVKQALAGMSEEERQAVLQRAQLQQVADQARDAAIAVQRGQGDREALTAKLDEVAAQVIEDETEDSVWHELTDYLLALSALLRGQKARSVPAQYAAHFVAVQQAARG